MCGGPLAWKSIRQDNTALSSCEAEILATNECVKDLESVKLRASDLGLTPNTSCTTVYNDNRAAVDWAASCTTKGVKHLNLRENQVREQEGEHRRRGVGICQRGEQHDWLPGGQQLQLPAGTPEEAQAYGGDE